MAWIEKDPSGTFHLSFRFGGRKFRRSLKTTNADTAHARKTQLEETIRLVENGIVAQKDQRNERKRNLVKQWDTPLDAQRQYHQSAIDEATNPFDRRRISNSSIENPSIEALELMAADLIHAVGD